MPEKTLQEVFGAGATQDANSLTIAKADLVAVGLTTATNVTAEKLLAAILKLAAENLTPDNRELDIDQSVSIEISTIPTFATRTVGNTTAPYIRDTITVELDKSYTSTGIDPDDY